MSGRINSHGNESAKKRLISKVKPEGNCLIWTGGMGSGGYGTFHFDGKNRSAHRVSYELYKGPIPEGMLVMHSCDNRRCINPDHLSLGTHQQNTADMVMKGRDRKASGALHGLAKLTTEIADEIRRRFIPYDRKNGSSALAREFCVSQATVHTLLRGETWRQAGSSHTDRAALARAVLRRGHCVNQVFTKTYRKTT